MMQQFQVDFFQLVHDEIYVENNNNNATTPLKIKGKNTVPEYIKKCIRLIFKNAYSDGILQLTCICD